MKCEGTELDEVVPIEGESRFVIGFVCTIALKLGVFFQQPIRPTMPASSENSLTSLSF